MILFRIGSRQYPVFDGTGAFLNGGRWNGRGRAVIYCAPNISCCRLELLVHIGKSSAGLRNHAFVEIDVPQTIADAATLVSSPPEGWDHPTDLAGSQAIGDDWFDQQKSLLLIVPSVASKGDIVLLINQRHADFKLLSVSHEQPLVWDERLFPAKDGKP